MNKVILYISFVQNEEKIKKIIRLGHYNKKHVFSPE